MNFLAHALLAGELETDRIGGVFGDFVKGLLPAGLPEPLASGVALHRAIDSFAESHPAFMRSRARISVERRRVGGVLVDLFYDHLLASRWDRYASLPLETFAASVYRSFDAHLPALPANAAVVAEKMRATDWLTSYREVAATAQAIDRMAIHRLRRPSTLGGGIAEFLADTEGFSKDFEAFIADAIVFAADWRQRRAQRVGATQR